MRSIRIGDRKLSDMKPEELVDFIYDFGYCLHDEYWNKPVLMEFKYSKNFSNMNFTFYQLRKEDSNRNEWTGHIFFGGGINNDRMGIYIVNNENRTGHGTTHAFSTKEINHFLKLGFDLPIYSDFCVEW